MQTRSKKSNVYVGTVVGKSGGVDNNVFTPSLLQGKLMTRFTGKTVLVTGGNSGMGLVTAPGVRCRRRTCDHYRSRCGLARSSAGGTWRGLNRYSQRCRFGCRCTGAGGAHQGRKHHARRSVRQRRHCPHRAAGGCPRNRCGTRRSTSTSKAPSSRFRRSRRI